MKLNKLLIVLFALTFVFFSGCEDSDDTTTLNDYLVEESLDLNNILDGWIVTAKTIHDNLDDYYVIDTRSEAAYNAGHIPDAVWADGSTLLDVAANNGGKTIAVHCYKGIGAAPKLVALRLSGYTDAVSMMFGMSAWGPADHADSVAVGSSAAYETWTSAVGDAADGSAGWVYTDDDWATPMEYDYPAIATDEIDDGAEYLAERVDLLLSEGFGYADRTALLDDPTGTFINNYWDDASWNLYGHFEGAYRVNSMSIAGGGIDNMNPDVPVVTYCWTSQTSGVIAAYLTILGYEAQSLSVGANGMVWSALQSHKWDAENGVPGENAPGSYELEVTP